MDSEPAPTARALLLQEATIWRELAMPSPMQALILRDGRDFIGQKLPRPYRKMKPRMCFKNAGSLVMGARGLIYCEGFAVRASLGIAIHHAWAFDPAREEVIDPTWDRPEEASYIGLTFSFEEAAAHWNSGWWSILFPREMANRALIAERMPEWDGATNPVPFLANALASALGKRSQCPEP